MGLMRFVVSPQECVTEEVLQQVYMSGIDRVAWQVEVSMEGSELVLGRAVSDSGNLHIPWTVEGYGRLTLSTGSLMERARPYHLPLELARGTIAQLSNQLAEWRTFGLSVPEKVTRTLSEARACFGRTLLGEGDSRRSAELAQQAIQIALGAGDLLVTSYIEQAIAVRRGGGEKLPVFLGGDLGSWLPEGSAAKEFLRCFNAATVPACWREMEPGQGERNWEISDRQVQWCRAHGLKVFGGPLLQLDQGGLPDWLYLYEDDFDNLVSCVTEFVRATINRYRGKVDFWQCAGRLTSTEILSLSEEEKLRLAACTIELARSIDPDAPTLLSFDQPWGEYLSRREVDLPPLYFADALARAGLDLGGVVLEINLGYHPGGTLPRTPLEFSRQLDHWSLLGLPLFVSISVPSAEHEDPLARRRVTVSPGTSTVDTQRAWIARNVPLMLSKPFIQGILWNQVLDSQPHDFPHGGLFDQQDRPKPALHSLAAIRQAHLR